MLEVILALSILGLAVAAVGELIRLGGINAVAARDKTTAHFLAESKLAEIKAGLFPAQTGGPNQFEPYETQELGWVYTIYSQPLDEETLLMVQIVVEKQAENARPVKFSLTSWMIDPQLDATPDDAGEATESDSTSASGTGASSTGGAASGALGGGS